MIVKAVCICKNTPTDNVKQQTRCFISKSRPGRGDVNDFMNTNLT
jgi:hypothetical protein